MKVCQTPPRLLLTALVTAMGTCLGPPVPGVVYEMGSEFHSVTTEIATRHVQWARPLNSGKLRMLVVAPRFAHRETAELMQRLDCECDVVMPHSYKELGTNTSIMGFRESDVLEVLRAHLAKPHDLIVLGNVPWALLPKPLQYEILKQVTEGTGLLYIPYLKPKLPPLFKRLFRAERVPALLRQGIPWGAFASLVPPPENAQTPLTSTSQATVPTRKKGCPIRFCGVLKQGHCAVLRWPTGAGGFHCLTAEPKTWIEYEYNMALVVRAALWSAGREPATDVRFPVNTEDWRSVNISVTGYGPAYSASAVVRDPWGNVVQRPAVDVKQGTAKLEIADTLHGGHHFLDVLVHDRKKRAVAWASTYFDVARDAAICSVETDREYYAPGDQVRITVAFTEPPAAGAELVLLALDVYDREWARTVTPVKPDQQTVTTELRAQGMLSTFNRLRADLVQDGTVTQRAFGELYVPLRRKPDFALGVWGGGGHSWLTHQRWKLQRELGVDATIFSGDIKADIHALPYSCTKFRHGGKGDIRKPCLTDPETWEQMTAHLNKVTQDLAKADVFAYSLGDEICLDVGNTSLCRSPTCLAEFRKWLKAEYGELDRLNAEWDTRFTDWDEVLPAAHREAKSAGNLAPWLDHRMFMDSVFVGGLARARDIIHEADPDVPVGAEGLWGSTSAYGMDWVPMTRKLRFLGPYWRSRTMVESIRCFKQPGTKTTTWFGNYGEQGIDIATLRWFPWNVLINGYNGISWYAEYRAVQFGAAATALAPDYRPTQGYAAALEEIRLIRSGPATLLPQLQRRHDGIAVAYSRPSIHVWGALADEIIVALEDLGLQYDMVDCNALAPDALRRAGYRLLVLPGICVLTTEQAANIARFVNDGGAVLAILEPGVYSAHGRERETPALNDTMGCRSREREPVSKYVEVRPKDSASFKASQVMPMTIAEGTTALARFEDNTPAASLKRVGKGMAVQLAFSLSGYMGARETGSGDLPVRSFLRNVLEQLGVRPEIKLAATPPVPGLELVRFSDGKNDYVALTRQPLGVLKKRRNEPSTVALQLPAPRHVFDVKTTTAIGNIDRIKTTVRPGDSRVFALMRREEPPPSLRLTLRPVRAGTEVGIKILAPGGYLRVIRLQIQAPDGNMVRFWTQALCVETGSAETWLYIALNTAPGTYTVNATDTVTGQQAQATFEVHAE